MNPEINRTLLRLLNLRVSILRADCAKDDIHLFETASFRLRQHTANDFSKRAR